MAFKTHIDFGPVIVPVNDEVHAMLDYAESAEARPKLEKARQELRDAEGIAPTAEYFADLNRRISKRAKKRHDPNEA